MNDLPPTPGSYLLLLHLPAAQTLPIGRLGSFLFPPGWYAYAGSAHGPGGLRGRLAHHLRPVARPHWHIDWLRAAAPLIDLCFEPEHAAGRTQRECLWAAELAALPGAALPAPRFGASDCRCPAHLIHLPAPPPPFAAPARAAHPLLTKPLKCSILDLPERPHANGDPQRRDHADNCDPSLV